MKQLSPKSVWLFFFSYLSAFFFLFIWASFMIIVILLDTEKSILMPWIGKIWVALPILILIFCYIWAKLSYHFYRYELVEHGFRKESGVIYKSYVTIPYDRIQNVDIYRGIIARFLGLSDLHIQTAGGFGQNKVSSEGRLPGLDRTTAEQLRDELILRSRQSRSSTTQQGL